MYLLLSPWCSRSVGTLGRHWTTAFMKPRDFRFGLPKLENVCLNLGVFIQNVKCVVETRGEAGYDNAVLVCPQGGATPTSPWRWIPSQMSAPTLSKSGRCVRAACPIPVRSEKRLSFAFLPSPHHTIFLPLVALFWGCALGGAGKTPRRVAAPHTHQRTNTDRGTMHVRPPQAFATHYYQIFDSNRSQLGPLYKASRGFSK